MIKNILLIFCLTILSCGQKQTNNRPKEANMYCSNFFIKGQFKNATHSFCGIIPEEIQYLHKDGKWKYWNIEGLLVAEGIFKLKKINVTGHGGCPYDKIEGVLGKKEWTFWDENGNKIKPQMEFLNKIKSCTLELMK